MRRHGLAFAGIAVSLLLGGIYFMVQRQTYAATGLVLQQKSASHTSWVYTADFDGHEEHIASGGVDGLRVWRVDHAHEV